MLAGFVLTPLALAIAPIATQSKTLLVALVAATSIVTIKGQIFESPRGLIFINAQTRDIVQNVYIRRVERVNGQLYNMEFDVIKDVKNPAKTGK